MGIVQTKYSVLDAEIRLITNKVELSAPVIFDKKKISVTFNFLSCLFLNRRDLTD